jgi:RNA polymerase sigma factor (sigma-70 family)
MNNANELTGLWDTARNGGEKAFASLHKALYPGLFIYAVKMIKDEDLADDLLQDLFIKFWQNKLRIGSISNVKAYFYRSARSIVLNHIKSSNLKDSKLDAMPEPDLEFSKEELILSQEFDIELKGLMAEALNKLPVKQREVVYMRFYEDLEYTQIAEITGIRYQSVINHVYRAIQLLRDQYTLAHIYAA